MLTIRQLLKLKQFGLKVKKLFRQFGERKKQINLAKQKQYFMLLLANLAKEKFQLLA